MKVLFFVNLLLWCTNFVNTNSTSLLNNLSINVNITDANEIVYFEEYKIGMGQTNIEINMKKNDDFGYILLQIHVYIYKITLAENKNRSLFNKQYGSNLGLVLFENRSITIINQHKFDVDCVITIVSYNNSTPVPGGCNLEGDLPIRPTLSLNVKDDFIQVDTSAAARSIKDDSQQRLCSTIFNTTKLNYVGLYYIFPNNNLTKAFFFAAVKKFLIPKYIQTIGQTAFKSSPNGPANRRTYRIMPGTAMMFNTVVDDQKGNKAAYVPTIVYSCNPFFWKEGCNFIFDDSTLQLIVGMLLFAGFIKTFLFCGVFSMIPEACLNSFAVGAYFTYYAIHDSDISESTMSTLVILAGVGCALLGVVLMKIGLVILVYIITTFVFSGIFTLNVFYVFEGIITNQYNESLYVIIYVFTLIMCFLLLLPEPISKVIWIIYNTIIGGYYLLLGSQFMVKSNLVSIPMNHFYQIQNPEYKYANGIQIPSKLDICLIVGVFGCILLGIILKKHKLYSTRENQRQRPGEEEPLISRWTNGSDEVFESPNSNSRYFRRLFYNSIQS